MKTSHLLNVVRYHLFPRLSHWHQHWPALLSQRPQIRVALAGVSRTRTHLHQLLALSHVGPVLATAILHVRDPDFYVPLDRHTLRLIDDEQVVPNLRTAWYYAHHPKEYLTLCHAVVCHVGGKRETLRKFVRRAP